MQEARSGELKNHKDYGSVYEYLWIAAPNGYLLLRLDFSLLVQILKDWLANS